MLFNNKLFNSIACLLSFTNLQLVIPGRTWILLYLGRTVYKHLWAYLALYGGPRWTLYQFQRGRSNSKQIDSFYFMLFNYFILGYFWLKTGVGQTSAEWVQTDPDDSSHYQYCCVTSQTSQRVPKCDISWTTTMNKIIDAERLRGSIGPQICKHFRDVIIIKKVTEKI